MLALSSTIGATVVDVLAFLNLGSDSTATISTSEKAAIGELPDSLLGSSIVKPLLVSVERGLVNQWRMMAIVKLPLPGDGSVVDGIGQDLMHSASSKCAPVSRTHASLLDPKRGSINGHSHLGKSFQKLLKQWRGYRIGFDSLSYVVVSSRSIGGP